MAAGIQATYFASPERSSDSHIVLLREHTLCAPFVCAVVDSIPYMVLLLDANRQIIHANSAVLDTMGLKGVDQILGKRPGEAFNCIYAHEMEAGCGTSKFCRFCGAAKALVNVASQGASVQQCRMLTKAHGAITALDLDVKAAPLDLDGEAITVFSIQDTSNQNRRRVLERLFFHDVLNLAGAVRGFLDLIKEDKGPDAGEYINAAYVASENLIYEIQSQKTIHDAEAGDLVATFQQVSANEALNEAASIIRARNPRSSVNVIVRRPHGNITIKTDSGLLNRVLCNLGINAVEASDSGQAVTMGLRRDGRLVTYWFHNQTHMPDRVKLQIFKRSFSTKGADRGLGTYGSKLITERYLKGNLSFTTTEEEGTIFSVSLPVGY